MPKNNCWEVMKCGREPGGEKVKELGVCPAATEEMLEGVHEGKKAGRACWAVAGTFCEGEVQGTFAHKYRSCTDCPFYRQVMKEEGSGYQTSLVLLKSSR